MPIIDRPRPTSIIIENELNSHSHFQGLYATYFLINNNQNPVLSRATTQASLTPNTIQAVFFLKTTGHLREQSLAHSISLPRSLRLALPGRVPAVPVSSGASAPSSKHPRVSSSSSSILRLFSAPISASTEKACALTLSVHGDRRFSAISNRLPSASKRE